MGRDVDLATLDIPVPQPVVGALDRQSVALLALAQRPLGAAALGDVGVGGHKLAARDGLSPDLDDRAVGTRALEAVRLEPARQRHPLGDLRLCVAGAVLGALSVEAEEVLQRCVTVEKARRKLQQLEKPLVEGRDIEVAIDHRDALVHVLQGHLERRPAARKLVLGALALGDVVLDPADRDHRV